MASNTSKRKKAHQDAIQRAELMPKLSKKGESMSVATAMKFAGFTAEEINDKALRRHVYRSRNDLASPDFKKKNARAELSYT